MTLWFTFSNLLKLTVLTQFHLKNTLFIPQGNYLWQNTSKFLQTTNLDADGQEGYAIAVIITGNLKRPPSKDNLLLYDSHDVDSEGCL